MDNNYTKKQIDDAKTAAEHEYIILRYLNTGYLDRDDAIKKYKQFNDNHLEYYMSMRASTILAGTAAPINDVPNDTIVSNLNQQLIYLAGKNLLEEHSNG